MEWWRRMVRKAMVAVRRKRKYGRGIMELEEEVETCGYRDAQVMWEMLRGFELKAQQHNQAHRAFSTNGSAVQSPSKNQHHHHH